MPGAAKSGHMIFLPFNIHATMLRIRGMFLPLPRGTYEISSCLGVIMFHFGLFPTLGSDFVLPTCIMFLLRSHCVLATFLPLA